MKTSNLVAELLRISLQTPTGKKKGLQRYDAMTKLEGELEEFRQASSDDEVLQETADVTYYATLARHVGFIGRRDWLKLLSQMGRAAKRVAGVQLRGVSDVDYALLVAIGKYRVRTAKGKRPVSLEAADIRTYLKEKGGK